MQSVELVLALVVLATVVATTADRLRAPAPSLLVVVGLLVGLVPGLPPVRVPPEVVSLLVLPPLLFSAGQELSLRELRRAWAAVSLLAVGLVVLSAAVVAALAVVLLHVPLAVGAVLGAVLASTDPVAVTALARRLALPPRLETVVSAESLFNDATSLVLYRVAVGIVVAGTGVRWGHAGVQLFVVAVGGAAIGAAVAALVTVLRRRTEEPVLEAVISLVTPYTAYVAAEALGTSGVTAVVVAAVALGAQTSRLTSARTRLQLDAVNGTVVFLLESTVFSLIGLALPTLVRDVQVSTAGWLLPTLAIAAAVVVTRVLWVFPAGALVAVRQGDRPDWQTPAVVAWAGTRGVVPLAAALSIPLTVAGGAGFPRRDLLLVVATGVVVLTVVVQGLTLEPLVRRSGVGESPELERRQEAVARRQLAEVGMARLAEVVGPEPGPVPEVELVRRGLQQRLERARRAVEAGDGDPTRGRDPTGGESAGPASPGLPSARQLRRALVAAETAELVRLRDNGEISDGVRRRLQRQLDLEDVRLGER